MKIFKWYLLLLTLLPFNVFSLEINSSNAILYNLNDDTVIFEKQSDEIVSIASLTKIMTTIVAIENIQNLDEKVIISTRDFLGLYEADASLAGFKVGQTVTYRDLLYGTFLSSGAEATQSLAFNIAGSIENFVKLMNEKALLLGLDNTHFSNTNGLDDKENYSTVSDVAKLLKYALKNDDFLNIYKTYSYLLSDSSMTIYSTFRYTAYKYNYDTSNIIGAKTGYTDNAGKCLASSAHDNKNTIDYLLVTCGADIDTSDAFHIKDAYNIYKYYFENYMYQEIVSKGDLLVSINTKYGKEKYANFYVKKPILYYLNNNYDKKNIHVEYDGISEITYKNKQGEILGHISIFYEDALVYESDIILNDEYKFSVFEYLKQNKIIIAFPILIIIFIILLIIKRKHI